MPKEMLDENAWLTERSPLPTFADEAIQRLADVQRVKGAYTGINIKLMKCTGMREAWKMLNYARAEGMKVMVGCMTETSSSFESAAAFMAANSGLILNRLRAAAVKYIVRFPICIASNSPEAVHLSICSSVTSGMYF